MRELALAFIVILVALFLAAYPQPSLTGMAGGLPNCTNCSSDDWPMFHRNLNHAGFVNASSYQYAPNIELLWKYDINNVVSSPIASDLDGDGKTEIVIGTYDGVYCFDNSGNLLWSYLTGSIDNFPTIADLSGYGEKEVMVSSNNGEIYCLNGTNGNLIWKSVCNGNGCWNDAPVIADINNDGWLEVIVIAGIANVFDRNGSKMFDFACGGGFDKAPSVADFNGDGKGEIVFNMQNNLCLHDNLGNLTWFYTTGAGGPGAGLPVIGDINNDDELEIVSSIFNDIYVFNATGSVIWKNTTGGRISSTPAIADIDGDEELEIVVGSTDGNVYCFDNTGKKIWNYYTESYIESSPAIADITGDGELDIIIGPDNGIIYCLNGNGERLWAYTVNSESNVRDCGGIKSSPAITDINGDGLLDIIVGAGNSIYVLSPSFIEDNIPPDILNVNNIFPYPNITRALINATITDNVKVAYAEVVIEKPDQELINRSMIRGDENNWFYIYLLPTQQSEGIYTFYIKAIDGNSNVKLSEKYFFQVLPYDCGDGICNITINETYSNCCVDCPCPEGQACRNNECVNAETEKQGGSSSSASANPPTSEYGSSEINETNKIKEIVPGEMANITIKDEGIGIKEIHMEVRNPVKDVDVKIVKLPQKPAQVTHEITERVYEYLELNITNVTDKDIARASVGFRVSKNWTMENKINKTTIKLKRYFNGTWHEMPTILIGESPEFIYYEAEVPGFSIFAITGEEIIEMETEICNLNEKRCAGNNLEQCNADGTEWLVIETCENGCDEETLLCKAPKPVIEFGSIYLFISFFIIAVVVIYFLVKSKPKEKADAEEFLRGFS